MQILFKNFDHNSECMLRQISCILFARFRCSLRAEGVRLIAMKEVRNYGKIVCIKNIFEMAGGRMHTPHLPPGYKLQKPSKESSIF